MLGRLAALFALIAVGCFIVTRSELVWKYDDTDGVVQCKRARLVTMGNVSFFVAMVLALIDVFSGVSPLPKAKVVAGSMRFGRPSAMSSMDHGMYDTDMSDHEPLELGQLRNYVRNDLLGNNYETTMRHAQVYLKLQQLKGNSNVSFVGVEFPSHIMIPDYERTPDRTYIMTTFSKHAKYANYGLHIEHGESSGPYGGESWIVVHPYGNVNVFTSIDELVEGLNLFYSEMDKLDSYFRDRESIEKRALKSDPTYRQMKPDVVNNALLLPNLYSIVDESAGRYLIQNYPHINHVYIQVPRETIIESLGFEQIPDIIGNQRYFMGAFLHHNPIDSTNPPLIISFSDNPVTWSVFNLNSTIGTFGSFKELDDFIQEYVEDPSDPVVTSIHAMET